MIFGCGYVGRALAQRLLQAGVRVGALTRNADKAAELKALGLQEVVVADLDSDAWHDALSGTYGAVVNCVSSAGGGLRATVVRMSRGRHPFYVGLKHRS